MKPCLVLLIILTLLSSCRTTKMSAESHLNEKLHVSASENLVAETQFSATIKNYTVSKNNLNIVTTIERTIYDTVERVIEVWNYRIEAQDNTVVTDSTIAVVDSTASVESNATVEIDQDIDENMSVVEEKKASPIFKGVVFIAIGLILAVVVFSIGYVRR